PAAVPHRGHPAAVLPAIGDLPRAARRPRHRHHRAGLPGRLPAGPLLLRRPLFGPGPPRAAEELAACDGCTGLDATPVPLFSRGPSKRTGLSASDPDGGWYVREGDHREREDDKGKPLRKIAWALEATIATMARPPGAPPAHPDLAIGLALARPGEDPGGTGARVLASIAARGHKASWLGYDRAYTQALPGRFHLPARALG